MSWLIDCMVPPISGEQYLDVALSMLEIFVYAFIYGVLHKYAVNDGSSVIFLIHCTRVSYT